MQKLYERINWENEPSILTPLNAVNLNKIDYAVDELDNRVVSLDSEKADQGDLLLSIKGITYDKQTGIFTFTWHNGTTMQVDLNIEKIPVSFSMNEEGIITMATTDGTEYTCDVASLIKAYIFYDSDQIDFSVTTAEDGSYHVTGTIKGGSITEDMLESGMLGRINAAKGYAETAITKSTESAASAETASTSAQSASESAENAGVSATAASESATASQASAEAAEQSASNAATSASNAGSAKTEAQKFAENASGSASSASKSATSASGSAGTATTKASEAATSAANAKDSETKAKEAEVKAGEYAEQARQYTPSGYADLVDEVGEIKEDISSMKTTQTRHSEDISNLKSAQSETLAVLSGTDRRLEYLWKKEKGILYDTEMINGNASQVTIPSGAMDFASLNMIGGMSRKCKNLFNGFTKRTEKITSLGNGWFKCDNTNSFYVYPQVVLPLNGTYTLSVEARNYNGHGIFYIGIDNDYSKCVGLSGGNITAEFNGQTRVMLALNANSTVEFRITLSEGSQVTDYEPYTDRLIDAKVDEIKSVGRNLLYPYDRQDLTITELEDGYINVKNTSQYAASGLSRDLNYLPDGIYSFYIETKSGTKPTVYFQTNKDDWSSPFNQGWRTITKAGYMKIIMSNFEPNTESTLRMMLVAGAEHPSFVPYRTPIITTLPQAIIEKCPDYGIGINADCYNYIDFENKKYHRNVGSVDLGSLRWTLITSENACFITADVNKIAIKKSYSAVICHKYNTLNGIGRTNLLDKMICQNIGNGVSNQQICVKDDSYADVNAFTQAVNGVMLYYELEEQDTVDLSDVWTDDLSLIQIEQGGTLQFHYPELDNGYEVAVPTQTEIMVKVGDVV